MVLDFLHDDHRIMLSRAYCYFCSNRIWSRSGVARTAGLNDAGCEWDTMFKQILDERKQKNLTITDFLLACGLSPNRYYFKQLSSKNPKSQKPSKRKNSPGLEFREAVAKYFAGQAVARSGYHQSFRTILADWCIDNHPFLRESEIFDIHLADPDSTDLIVYAFKKCTLTDDAILDVLLADTNVRSSLGGSVPRIISRRETQLLACVR